MLRVSTIALSGGMKPYHDWVLREPLKQNYNGWRILDNPKYDRIEALIDFGGYVRHLDPIIDDPRLTHKQRVCRLYKWACKELKAWGTYENGYKFNLAYKVVRNRFERYRYVTDPAMCDMMVRETQKYLRETCSTPHHYRYNHTSKDMPGCQAAPMFYPDHAQCYDHWTPIEVMWYDDAKMHRYRKHHPLNSMVGPKFDRFGIHEDMVWQAKWKFPVFTLWCFYMVFWQHGGFYPYWENDPRFHESIKRYNPNLRQAIEYEERSQRARNSVSTFGHNWDQILGYAKMKEGYFNGMGRFRQPGGQMAVEPPQ